MNLNRRSMIIATAGMSLTACVGIAPAPRPRRLTVATFNIWHDMSDWKARLPLIVAALRGIDADVIALQEVLQDAAKSLPNQADTIAKALGDYSAHFFSTDPAGAPRRYGNAILSRVPVLAETAKKLQPLDDYRTALRLRVVAHGRPIDVVVTHLAWQEDAGSVRARQVADLLAWLPNDGVPLIVLGDFNAPLTDSGLATLTSSRFASALPLGAARTTLNPAQKHPERVIDHIFAERGHFAVERSQVFADQPTAGEYPSDHFGVVATLALR
ncbi:endonuclease/exonuclease/phosphatase family protein [Sphingomonas sp. LY160]|uniref:endonuclease/exonuclease/phosphatase family protein n=1 Tax=Sphingomonas sp. LY160 TaxID=3095342 RepID=UPI002ADEAD00|nr:endonuclease/exonuclease/phosphatase family protein [Sphingomonas sp. LY160]MEA1072295.1 endonuclease/exonuclease/phosphatase family protein [Sphingomonas sp. LY160]